MIDGKPFKVVDNFLSDSEYSVVKEAVEEAEYIFVPRVSGMRLEGDEDSGKDPLTDTGFACSFYNQKEDGSHFDRHPYITQLFGRNLTRYFDLEELLRIRLGLFTPTGTEPIVHDPHVDYRFAHWTALFYTCTEHGGGETYLWNHYFDNFTYANERDYVRSRPDELTLDKAIKVEPRENRVILFRGDMFHASSTPRKILKRTAININFVGWPKHVKT